ncbi:MAG: PKD domain-containing protein [Bacteroidia bacterium]|nr:PKD domain-containing protein [Bacteroidia bacterium]
MKNLYKYLTVLIIVNLITQQLFADGCNTGSFTMRPSCTPGQDPLHACFNPGTSSDEPDNTDYTWDFGDGQTYFQANNGTAEVCHTYTTPGTYTVHLNVYVHGCFSCFNFFDVECDLYQQITVGTPIISQSLLATNICVGGSVNGEATLTLSSLVGVKWAWDPINLGPIIISSTELSQTNLSQGMHSVVIQTASCAYVHTFNVIKPTIADSVTTYYNAPTGTTIPNVSCKGFNDGAAYVSCIDCSTPATFTWSNGFVDVSSDSVSTQNNLTAGTYTVSYIDAKDCAASTTVTLIEPLALVLTTTVSPTTCGTVPIGSASVTNITGGNPGYNIVWTDGTTAMTNNNLPNGVSSCIVTDTNGCVAINSITLNNTIQPIPTISANNVCVYNNVTFTNTSTVSALGATYDWDFGDATPHSTAMLPLHKYATEGSYIVTLIVTDLNGCIASTTVNVVIYPKPLALFTYKNDCVYTPIAFANASTIAVPDNISTYSYNFGDGSPAVTNSSTTHQYASAGNYNVSLHIVSNNNCIADTSFPITAYVIPKAEFNADSNCVNTPPNVFVNQSTILPPDVIQYNTWNFGDGQSSILTNPTHAYAINNLYNANLLVVSNHGCRDSIVHPVKVLAKPQALFIGDKLESCSPLCTQFSYIGTSTNITNYSWTFGNYATSTISNPNKCFENTSHTTDNSYNVGLIVKNNLGCYDTAIIANYLTVWHNPLAAFTADPIVTTTYASEIEFTNTSVGANSYAWNFGDGTNSIKINPLHTFIDSGKYNIMLIATTIHNCKDTAYGSSITINAVAVLFIPNAFTPNADGVNDYFNIKAYGITEYTLDIFNRWGELIATIKDDNGTWKGGWDGTDQRNNTACKQDVYVWQLYYKNIFNVRKNQAGIVTLVK